MGNVIDLFDDSDEPSKEIESEHLDDSVSRRNFDVKSMGNTNFWGDGSYDYSFMVNRTSSNEIKKTERRTLTWQEPINVKEKQ